MPTTRPGYIYGGPTDGWVAIGQEAAVNPIYYQATEPTGASTGSIWIDEDDDVPSVDSSLFYRWKKTAVGGETTLSGNDDASLPLKYTVGYEELYLNGVLLVRDSDYTASTGTTITGLTALVAGDVVTIMSQVAYAVGDSYTQSAADARFVNKNVGGMFLVSPTSVTSGGTLNANGTITVGSAVTSVVVNGAFSAAYDNYEIIWSGGVMASSSNDSQLGIVLNGSATGYNNILRYSNGTSNLTAAQSNFSAFSWVGGGSTGSGLLQAKLYAPFLPVHTRCESNSYNSWNNTYLGSSNGWHNSSTSHTGFTITVTGTGSMTGGTIRIYGYNNGA